MVDEALAGVGLAATGHAASVLLEEGLRRCNCMLVEVIQPASVALGRRSGSRSSSSETAHASSHLLRTPIDNHNGTGGISETARVSPQPLVNSNKSKSGDGGGGGGGWDFDDEDGLSDEALTLVGSSTLPGSGFTSEAVARRGEASSPLSAAASVAAMTAVQKGPGEGDDGTAAATSATANANAMATTTATAAAFPRKEGGPSMPLPPPPSSIGSRNNASGRTRSSSSSSSRPTPTPWQRKSGFCSDMGPSAVEAEGEGKIETEVRLLRDRLGSLLYLLETWTMSEEARQGLGAVHNKAPDFARFRKFIGLSQKEGDEGGGRGGKEPNSSAKMEMSAGVESERKWEEWSCRKGVLRRALMGFAEMGEVLAIRVLFERHPLETLPVRLEALR